MTDFAITVRDRDVTVDRRPTVVVSGSVNVYTMSVDLDDTWDGYTCRAVFRCESELREALIVDGACNVPWEALVANGSLYIGVYGINGDKRMPTCWTPGHIYVASGTVTADASQDPSPTVFEELVVQTAYNRAAAEAARDAAESAKQGTAADRLTVAGDKTAVSADREAVESMVQQVSNDATRAENAANAAVDAATESAKSETAAKDAAAQAGRDAAQTTQDREAADASKVAAETAKTEAQAAQTAAESATQAAAEAARDAAEVFESKMAEKYDAGIFHIEKYNLHEDKLFYAYTTSTFSGWVSQYEVPADLTVTELRFYITAREDPVTKVQVMIAIGERADSAICFQTYLDVEIQPGEERLVSCLIPHVKLQQGETIFIGVDANVVCSQGFGYKGYDESVSWYVISGAFRPMENHGNGSNKKLYMEMLGFDQGVFTTDRLLDIVEDHEERIGDVEEWSALVDEFEKEPSIINEQNPLPVINPTERYNYSNFVGWSCPIGCPTDFDTLIFTIKNRSTEDYLENVRCFITEDDKSGAVLIDEVMSDVHVAPGEWRKIEFHFSRIIDNAEGNKLYAGFSCDQYIAFMGGSTGIVLQPPEYGVVCYNAGTPSIDNMMKEPSRWARLDDPNQNNTSKIDILMAKQATRYGLGSIKEPITDLIHEVTGDQIDAAIYEKASVALPPRVILPDVFHAVVGDTLQLFYRGLVEHPYPYFYNIEFRCDIGKNTPRYYEVTPTAEQAGDHTLTVRVRDHLDNILAEATTVLRVHAVGESPSLRKNVLCVGDSLTGSGTWCKEALRRLTETGGTPSGLGLSNIRFIGTKKNGECGYEGYGGWTWASYLNAPTTTSLGMWVYGSHDKDNTDQHSLWEDASGNIWSMETIEASRIKFTRYQDHTASMPLGAGTLHHYQNATHTADINYDETVYAEGNPFWDGDEGQVNFRTYCERNGFDRVDYMVTLLSWNGMAASQYQSSTTLIESHVNNAKRLIRILHEQYPNAKVKMMGIQLPSVNGGTGHSYGANSQYSNWYGLVRSVMNMNLAYQAMANENEFKDYVEFINISGQFDSENNMPRQSKPVNTRCSLTEQVGTNGVHPSTDGYYQIGDAAYRALVPELTE